MDKSEIGKEMAMPYDDLCNYLQGKYGTPEKAYFRTEECISRSKITRTQEGLYIHHIREDMGIDLSNEKRARKQPFSWQARENLTYCNILEHLILHLKIAVIRSKTWILSPAAIFSFLSTGITLICQDINDLYSFRDCLIESEQKSYDLILDNYDDYLQLISALLFYIEDHYDGEINPDRFLKRGKEIVLADGTAEILDISADSQRVEVMLYTGKSFWVPLSMALCGQKPGLTYHDWFELAMKSLCTGMRRFYQNVYQDIIHVDKTVSIQYAKQLEADFRGYGFPQFTRYYLEDPEHDFGALNVDEYLHLGLPSTFGNPKDEMPSEVPEFWIGEIPEDIASNNDYNYLVRVEASFFNRSDMEPFLRYKGEHQRPDKRFPLYVDEENNYEVQKGYIVENSFRFSNSDQKWYRGYKDENGRKRDYTLILTIAKADIQRFLLSYIIEKQKVLDGCYWKI